MGAQYLQDHRQQSGRQANEGSTADDKVQPPGVASQTVIAHEDDDFELWMQQDERLLADEEALRAAAEGEFNGCTAEIF
jgi:hypothetical protein